MDTLCGLGLPELIIILLVGFVVIGPKRSRELAVSTGRVIRRAMRSEWWREFNQVTNALRDLPNTLVRMAELEDDLRRVRTDLNQASRLDINNPGVNSMQQPPTGHSDLDPWGIGQTSNPPEPSSDKTEPPEDKAPL